MGSLAKSETLIPETLSPLNYLELLSDLSSSVLPERIIQDYYLEYAQDVLLLWPNNKHSGEELGLEGLEIWDTHSPTQNIDWLASLSSSPLPIPGLTMKEKKWVSESEKNRALDPFLDIYLDASGSMPHPSKTLSIQVLSACVLALSSIRRGFMTRVTLWGQEGQAIQARTKNEIRELLPLLTGYFGGMTHFPLDLLLSEEALSFGERHVVLISDFGFLSSEEWAALSGLESLSQLSVPPVLLLSQPEGLPLTELESWQIYPLESRSLKNTLSKMLVRWG